MSENITAAGDGQSDLLESLLVVAAEKAAKKEADEALRKGFVTREQINSALSAFADNLENTLVEKITEALGSQVTTTVQKALDAPGMRKSTILTPEDERDADPVAYILKKGREQGPEAFDDTEKRIIWELTYKGLSKGMKDSEDEE